MFYSQSTNGFYSSAVHSVMPDDVVPISPELYSFLLLEQEAGKIVSSDTAGIPIARPPDRVAMSSEQIIAEFTAAIQQRLDDFARTRNYDSILSACTYATSTVPKFAAEGQYCVDARDATWSACYAILADVQAGTRPMPTLEQIMSELPVLEWTQ